MEAFRVRLNCIDHYQATPTAYDPPLRNDIRPSQVAKGPKVPVIRVFGSTETGQKVCAHIHGAFPYLFVEYPGTPAEDEVGAFIYRLHLSIDHALAVSYRKDQYGPGVRYVARITLVKGVPFYGFHVGYRFFLKIYMFNPIVMTRLADLLQQGVIMKRPFQPYEAHLQFLLQFMSDYNLYGCGYLEASATRFRAPVPERSPHLWHSQSIPPEHVTDDDVGLPRVSHCSIEVDICVQDILNRHQVRERRLHHDFVERLHPMPPDMKLVHSMAGLWRDEARRRKPEASPGGDGDADVSPVDVHVSMSADPRDSQPPGWLHEDEDRTLMDELIRAEGDVELDFDEYIPIATPFEDSVKTVLESVEDLYPRTLLPVLFSNTTDLIEDEDDEDGNDNVEVDVVNIPLSQPGDEDYPMDSDEEEVFHQLSTPKVEVPKVEVPQSPPSSPPRGMSSPAQAPGGDGDDADIVPASPDMFPDMSLEEMLLDLSAKEEEVYQRRRTALGVCLSGLETGIAPRIPIHYKFLTMSEERGTFSRSSLWPSGLTVDAKRTHPYSSPLPPSKRLRHDSPETVPEPVLPELKVPEPLPEPTSSQPIIYTPPQAGQGSPDSESTPRAGQSSQERTPPAGQGSLTGPAPPSGQGSPPNASTSFSSWLDEEDDEVLDALTAVTSNPDVSEVVSSDLSGQTGSASASDSANSGSVSQEEVNPLENIPPPSSQAMDMSSLLLASSPIVPTSEKQTEMQTPDSVESTVADMNVDSTSDLEKMRDALAECSDANMLVYAMPPPAYDTAFEDIQEYGLPGVVYQDPFYSRDKDVPPRSREYAGRSFKLEGKSIAYLPDFDPTGLVVPKSALSKDIDAEKASIKAERRRRSAKCTLLSWEIAKPPPSYEEVSDWWARRERRAARRRGRQLGKRVNINVVPEVDAQDMDVDVDMDQDDVDEEEEDEDENDEDEDDVIVDDAQDIYTQDDAEHEDDIDFDVDDDEDDEDEDEEDEDEDEDEDENENNVEDEDDVDVDVEDNGEDEKDEDKDEDEDMDTQDTDTQDANTQDTDMQDTDTQDTMTRTKFRSQIEGPTPVERPPVTRTIRREVQYMSTMSIEVHVNSRGTLIPNPEHDEVQCIFWAVRSDAVDANHEAETGVIVVCTDDIMYERIRRQTAGPALVEMSELDLLVRLVEVVRTNDPDVLTGYEVHGSSWGYLMKRARVQYDYDLCDELSRMKSQSHGRFGKNSDRWGFNTTSTIRVTGRHMINIWRAMRGELNLLQYTMENVVWHLLHRRIPHYSWKTLTDWYRSGKTGDLVKVLDYYATRTALDLEILEANDVIARTSEQARLLGVDFFSVFSRGSQYKVESIMFRIAKPENLLLVSPSRRQVGGQNALECLPLVMEPQSAFYNSPLVVLDFQSLYPSVMIAYNYCYSTFLGRITDWQGLNKMGFTQYRRVKGFLALLRDHINVSPNGMMYVKPEIRKSLLAKMLTEILETRVMVKSSMKGETPDRRQQLNNRQLALKLLANVTYGYTSASFSGRMPCSEIADSIVQTGRETLERAIAHIHSVKRWGAEVVYGDTDSLFVYLRGRTREQAFDIGAEIAKAITDMNPRPIKLKFEKVYHPCVLLAKKRYVGYKYETRDQTRPVFDAKGIETVRRDGTPAEQKMEEKALRMLFETADLSRIKRYFQAQCAKIMRGNVSIQDFCFAKEVRLGTYAADKGKGTAPAGAMISTRKMLVDARAEPQYGERVPYVVITGAPGARLIDRCVSPEDLLANAHWRLDAEYYISKNIIPPLDRIFCLVGAHVRGWYDEMPKVQRLHRVLPGTGKKGTLDSFLQSQHCVVCRRRIGVARKKKTKEKQTVTLTARGSTAMQTGGARGPFAAMAARRAAQGGSAAVQTGARGRTAAQASRAARGSTTMRTAARGPAPMEAQGPFEAMEARPLATMLARRAAQRVTAGGPRRTDLCNRCRRDVPSSVMQLQARVQYEARQYEDILSVCRTCSGLSPLEEVKCDSKDCPVFWKRTRQLGKMQLERASSEPVIQSLLDGVDRRDLMW